MNDIKNSRFKSYIEDSSLENIPLGNEHKTKLLDGELLICEVPDVRLYHCMSDRKNYTLGNLSVTTFKLSFLSSTDNDEFFYQKNLLLGPNEVCLSSIDIVYQVGEKSKKKLNIGQNISSKVKELQIVCKNMRMLHFGFKDSPKNSGKNVVNAVLHHSVPKRRSLLFAFDYRLSYLRPSNEDVIMFRSIDDWRREMERTNCKLWRICRANERFDMSPYLPQIIVVPDSICDDKLYKASAHFRSHFCPVWVWNTKEGAALVRVADLEPTITDRTQENIMFENIRKSHRQTLCPKIMDLTKDCPSHKDIQQSFNKLRELCISDSVRSFNSQDGKFYSILDSTKWLQYVSICLSKATEGATCLRNKTTVVLQEGNGRDMNCIISSLIQLILDPYWRNKCGFQSLIQKEWIVLGHPFLNRLGLVYDQETEPAPYFLLFLDCVWQLTVQYPTAFQFSESFLTTLWDSVHVTIFGTFIFNCEHDYDITLKERTSLLSTWDWSHQFTDRETQFFCNPLYDDSFVEHLEPKTGIPFLDIWSQCYFRWIPRLEIRNGGRLQIDLSCRLLALDIYMMRQLIKGERINENVCRNREEISQLMQKVNSFFPFGQNGSVQEILADSDFMSIDGIDSQSILNLTASGE